MYQILPPEVRVGSRHDGIRSAPSCTNFIKLHDESVESVLAIPIRMRASSWGLYKNKGLGFARRTIPHGTRSFPIREPPLKQHL